MADLPDRAAFDFWVQPVFKNDDGSLWCPGVEGEPYLRNPDSIVRIGGGGAPFALAGQELALPGLCTVHVHKEYAFDKKKPVGSHGARVTIHGIDAAEIEIEVMIWTPEQKRQFDSVWSVIFPGSKGSQQPRDVAHPTFTSHGIKSMIVVNGRGWERGPVVNSRVWIINGIEFAKLSTKDVTTTPKGSKPVGEIYGNGISHPTPGSNPANTGPH